MVFSYGFLDAAMDKALWLVLDLQGIPDDPLGFAKQAVFKSAPTLGIYDLGHTVEWTSHFIWFVIYMNINFNLLVDYLYNMSNS